MKCYYEILGVDKTVTSDAIKKAYYKLSLRWHPDKNPDNISEATEVFQQIQTAYKVLSNPQERSWYDKNRERFLSMSFNSEDELYDLINNVIYQGYGDDENGFYAKYEFVFSVLIEREKDACRFRGENLETIPNFGNSLSDYKDVVGPFYFFWESFSTKMSFHWKNKHEIDLSIPRDIRRAMEKENTDERNTARKQYNKTIQNLISTLKSRDPRIKVWKQKLQSKAIDNEKKAVKMAQKAWERSHKKLNFQNSVPSYGDFTVDELEEKLNNLEIEHGKTCIDEESEKEDLLCVSCNKYFKSVAAFNNHEKSKNHKKNLAALRELMLKENEEFFADFNDIPVKECSSKSEINIESERDAINELECDLPLNNDNEVANVQIQSDCNSNEILIKEKISENSIDNTTVDDKISADNTTVDDKKSEISVDNTIVDDKVISNEVKSEKKRRRKPKSEREQVETISKTTDDSLICDKCGNEFPTRNKLFQHVKSSGHATIKDMKKNKK